MSLALGPDHRPHWQQQSIILGLVIPGVTLTIALLTLCGYAALNPVSRQYLDRVSFRLLVYALVANLVFGITFMVSAFMAYPGWTCDLLSFVPNLSLMFSAGMFFCMALNLQLVLAHNVNGQKMEKYYVLGTTLVSLVCNIVPYASGKLGWNAINGTCWYRSTDLAEMMRWLISTQTFWIMLSAVGEVGAFLTILGYLIAYELDMRRLHTDTQFKTTYLSEASHCAGSTILKFRNIILRIGLYPLVSCLLNISTSIIDMYQTKNPESSELWCNWRLNLTDVAIYAGRPLIYGLLAATDPDNSETQSHSPRWPPPSACLSTVIEMPPSEVDCDETSHEETFTAPTLGTILEEGKGVSGQEHDQSGITRNTLAPTQRASIDVVCHI
ncbi:hypothetical protein B0H19DRAFT_1187315 [Mycena capillaripes]|nr:hypothetical protein B0H19DRAFT_1187315 [Mycena capillaripes]